MLKIGSILLSPEIGHLYFQRAEPQAKLQGKDDQLELEATTPKPLQRQKICPSLKDSRSKKKEPVVKPLKPTKDHQSRKEKHIMARKKLQMVWPKDGPKGSQPRGLFGGLRDIFGGTGPDMFVQKAGSHEAITPGDWGNWDSYHDPQIMLRNMSAPKPFVDREFERYDPYSRKYTTWAPVVRPDEDRYPYPRYTTDEMKTMYPRILKNKYPKPSEMGSEWSHIGPKRFRPEHDYFWQHAHRIGQNYADGLPWDAPINPWLQMGQRRPGQVRGYTKLHWP